MTLTLVSAFMLGFFSGAGIALLRGCSWTEVIVIGLISAALNMPLQYWLRRHLEHKQEHERRRLAAEQRRAALVHLFHPRTPFNWFCGARADVGHGRMGGGSDDSELTCLDCIKLKPLHDSDRAYRLGQLAFNKDKR